MKKLLLLGVSVNLKKKSYCGKLHRLRANGNLLRELYRISTAQLGQGGRQLTIDDDNKAILHH